MSTVEFCALVDSDAGQVWSILRQFGRIQAWHPGIVESHIEQQQADSLPGVVRQLRLRDGGVVRERLLALDDRQLCLTYRFEEAPLPLQDYVASVRVLGLSGQARAVVHWQASFTAPTLASAADYQALISDLIVAGHDGLALYLKAGDLPDQGGFLIE